LIQELYEKYPDYLFAKIQYVGLYLRNKNFQKIPVIFNNKFDLQLLYTERKVFHISEMLSLYRVYGRIFLPKKRFSASRKMFYALPACKQ